VFSYNQIPTWKKAEEVTPSSLLKQVTSKKETRYLNISSIQAMQIPSQGAGNLYIFDFRSPQLCGAGGCLYSIYNESGQPVLEFIALSHLPPKQKLIEVLDTVNQGFPCLKVTQTTNMDNKMSQTEFCYRNNRYIRFNKNLVEGKYE
jgi:hypothetical protein